MASISKLLLVLAEAGLELIPKEIRRHPAVISTARARGKDPGRMLLDISLHYAAAKNLRDWRKRGRPDIAHVCMLIALSSLLNRRGLLELVVHTYGGLVIRVNPEVKIPRNYPRFVGLIEQLLTHGRVPPSSEQPLLWIHNGKLEDYIGSWRPDFTVLLDEKGEFATPKQLASSLVSHERPAVIIGAFQSGEFSESILRLAERRVSIAPEPLDAWYVVARVISAVEDAVGLP